MAKFDFHGASTSSLTSSTVPDITNSGLVPMVVEQTSRGERSSIVVAGFPKNFCKSFAIRYSSTSLSQKGWIDGCSDLETAYVDRYWSF